MNRSSGSSRQIRSLPGLLKLPSLISILGIAVVAGLSAGSVLYADFSLAQWEFLKPIELPSSYGKDQLVELPLDQEVYRETNTGETDLRVIAGRNREVPYQLVVQEKRSQRESVPVEIQDIGFVPGQYSSFVADLGKDGTRHNEVEIGLTGKNFRRIVTVETSLDGETWAVVQDNAEIYDFTSANEQFNARDTSAKYPESTARYLKVKVAEPDAQPLKIGGASVFLTEETPARETTYLPETVSSSENPETGATIHALDLASSGIPLSRLSFQADSVNLHRRAAVEGSVDGTNWVLLAEGEVYSFDTPKFAGSRLELNFPEGRFSRYRLVVEDEDDSPLPLTGFTFQGVDRKLLFHPEPGIGHSLYYGNPMASAPSYDLERILPYLDTEDALLATLGSQQSNQAFSGLDVPLTERLPWLLPTGVALAAMVVAALLYGVVRRAKTILPPPGEGASS